jgi:hypothetical protein
LKIIPMTIKAANEFIKQYHRHNDPTVSGKFALGCTNDEGKLIGAAVSGRPVGRGFDDGKTLEIYRVATDGTFNANSFIYGRIKRIAQLMGYQRIFTYTLVTETGATMRAIGAKEDGVIKAREWSCKSRPRRSQDVYKSDKMRWML